jgi:hypothetical protein
VTEYILYLDVFSKAILDWWVRIIGSAVFSGKLCVLNNLLHLVHLFYTSNLKVRFMFHVKAANFLNRTSV